MEGMNKSSKRVKKLRQTKSLELGESLWRWVVHKFDTLLDAAFQPSFARLEKLLLRIIHVWKDIDGLLRSRGLKRSQYTAFKENACCKRTPSSTGTEK